MIVVSKKAVENTIDFVSQDNATRKNIKVKVREPKNDEIIKYSAMMQKKRMKTKNTEAWLTYLSGKRREYGSKLIVGVAENEIGTFADEHEGFVSGRIKLDAGVDPAKHILPVSCDQSGAYWCSNWKDYLQFSVAENVGEVMYEKRYSLYEKEKFEEVFGEEESDTEPDE